jgi:hypothetical protein
VESGKKLTNDAILQYAIDNATIHLIIRSNAFYDEDWRTTDQYFPDQFSANIQFPDYDPNEGTAKHEISKVRYCFSNEENDQKKM